MHQPNTIYAVVFEATVSLSQYYTQDQSTHSVGKVHSHPNKSLLFLSNIAHDHTTLSSVASKFGRGKMAENLHACNNLGMGWDWVEDVCFPVFLCFFEMCVIPKSFSLY